MIDTQHPYSKIKRPDQVPEYRDHPDQWELLPDTTEGYFIVLKRKHAAAASRTERPAEFERARSVSFAGISDRHGDLAGRAGALSVRACSADPPRCHQAPRRLVSANAGSGCGDAARPGDRGGELAFACFADFSDTFGVSNVSKRWLAVHIEGEKNNERLSRPQRADDVRSGRKKANRLSGRQFHCRSRDPADGGSLYRPDRRPASSESSRANLSVANMALPAYDASFVTQLAKDELLKKHYEMAACRLRLQSQRRRSLTIPTRPNRSRRSKTPSRNFSCFETRTC